VVERGPRQRCVAALAEKGQDEPAVNYNKEFGYSRKDVVLIGVGLVAVGYALYYGFQSAGVDPFMAGNFTQLIIIVGLCVLWVGSYVFRVMNKVQSWFTCCSTDQQCWSQVSNGFILSLQYAQLTAWQ
jgi:hypothetical protein